MPRRLPRVPCPVDGCETPIIEGYVMCKACWRSLPPAVKKASMARWRAVKAFLTPRTYELRPNLDAGEMVHFRAAKRRHFRSCDLVIAKAGRIRKARGLAPDDVLECKLKELGLL